MLYQAIFIADKNWDDDPPNHWCVSHGSTSWEAKKAAAEEKEKEKQRQKRQKEQEEARRQQQKHEEEDRNSPSGDSIIQNGGSMAFNGTQMGMYS